MTIVNQIISFKLSGISYSGTSTQLNSTAGVTPGTCIASKALIVDSFRNITNINALTVTTLNATTINGTLASGPQTGITSLGTLANMSISNNMNIVGHDGGTRGLVLGSTLVTASGLQLNYNNVTTIGVAEASKTLILNSSGSISGINSLSSTSLTTTNLTINGTLLTVSGTQLNYNNVTTPGMAQNSRSLVLDSNGSISGIISVSTFGLTATNITGTLTSGPQNNITSVGTLTSLTMSGAISGVTNITMSGNLTTTGTITANNLSGTITTSAQPNITSLGTVSDLTVSGQITATTISATNISVGGTNITSALTNLGSISGITNGTALGDKALILDASRNIININSVTSTNLIATTITGSLSTASQPNVTSLGTLTGLTMSGAISGATNIAMTGSLTGANSISSTSLNGRIDTASQPNITSLGTLTNLLVNGNIGMGMTSNSLPPAQLIINSSIGSCLRLSFGAPTGSAVNFTDFTLNSSGALTVNSSNNIINLQSNVVIGKSNSENVLYFNGVTGDPSNSTVISERIYNTSGEFSELLLFKGNDPSGSFGPDRIRLRAGEILFQFINSGEDYSTLADNNNALIMGSDGRIGINSRSNSTQQFTINSTAGNCLRLVNNDTDSTSVNINIPSAGTITFKTSSSASTSSTSLQIGDTADSTGNVFLLGTTATSTSTGGLIRMITTVNGNYIQSGQRNSSGSSADLIIGDMSQTITASARKIIFKANGKVGFGTSAPNTALEINDETGNCLRLTHNDNDGTATNYADILVSSTGSLTIAPSSTNTNITGSLSITNTLEVTGTSTFRGSIIAGNTAVSAASWTTSGIQFRTSAITYTNTTSGTAVSAVFNSFARPTLAASSALTTTNAATVYIDNSPAAGTNQTITNAYSLWVNSGNSLFGGPLTVNGATTLSSTLGVTGVATLSNDLILSGVSATLSISGASARLVISNTTASTSSSTGALQVAGGAYFGAASVFEGTLRVNAATTLANTLTVNGATSLTNTLGVTGVTTLSSNLTLSGPSATLSISGTSARLTISNTTASTSSTTGALQVAGGAYFGAASLFAGNLTNNATIIAGNAPVTAASWTTSGIQFRTSANIYTNTGSASSSTVASAVFNSFARPTLAASNTGITTTNAATVYIDNSPVAGTNQTITNAYSLWVNSGNSLFGGNVGIGMTSKPTYTLDFGSTAQNMHINLFGGNYGIGACNNNLQSFSDNGFTWHTVDATVTGNGSAPGTQIGRLHSSGHFEASSGIRAGTYSVPPYSGAGVEMHYASDIGDVFAYDRTNNGYKTLRLNGPSGITILSDGKVGIGVSSPTVPLEVGTVSTTFTGNYGYLSSTVSGFTTAGNTGSVNFSAKFNGRIYVTQEVDVFSDRRIKENIREITEDESERFINTIKPIHFKYKNNGKKAYGYIAQDIMKAGFDDIVQIHKQDGLEEEIEDDGFVNPKDYGFTVAYDEIPAILHKYILKQNDKIKNLEQQMVEMQKTLELLLQKN
jgi:hypothetical protein